MLELKATTDFTSLPNLAFLELTADYSHLDEATPKSESRRIT
jgi:hypothetical protein